MDIKEQVLKVMKEAGKPVSAGEVENYQDQTEKTLTKLFKL